MVRFGQTVGSVTQTDGRFGQMVWICGQEVCCTGHWVGRSGMVVAQAELTGQWVVLCGQTVSTRGHSVGIATCGQTVTVIGHFV